MKTGPRCPFVIRVGHRAGRPCGRVGCRNHNPVRINDKARLYHAAVLARALREAKSDHPWTNEECDHLAKLCTVLQVDGEHGELPPDVEPCVVFWDGRHPGTLDAVVNAANQGIPVRIVPGGR